MLDRCIADQLHAVESYTCAPKLFCLRENSKTGSTELLT